jgi:hypothetical protein
MVHQGKENNPVVARTNIKVKETNCNCNCNCTYTRMSNVHNNVHVSGMSQSNKTTCTSNHTQKETKVTSKTAKPLQIVLGPDAPEVYEL